VFLLELAYLDSPHRSSLAALQVFPELAEENVARIDVSIPCFAGLHVQIKSLRVPVRKDLDFCVMFFVIPRKQHLIVCPNANHRVTAGRPLHLLPHLSSDERSWTSMRSDLELLQVCLYLPDTPINGSARKLLEYFYLEV
jgi:hypothetical protein